MASQTAEQSILAGEWVRKDRIRIVSANALAGQYNQLSPRCPVNFAARLYPYTTDPTTLSSIRLMNQGTYAICPKPHRLLLTLPCLDCRGRKSSKVSYPAGVRWVMAMGPENVQLLKDIRVRSTPYAGSFDLPDLCPATRFIAHAGRNGVDLPRGCVSGFAYAFFTHHDGEDLKVLLHAYGIYKVWKMVDEACLVYRNSFDVLPVKGETRSLTFVASTWDYQTKPRTLKNA